MNHFLFDAFGIKSFCEKFIVLQCLCAPIINQSEMDKIYQCEDSIEQVKFLLAALKIETAFTKLSTVITRKQINFFITFLAKLRIYSNIALLNQLQKPILHLELTTTRISQNRKIWAYFKILTHTQRQERKGDKTKSSRDKKQSIKSSIAEADNQPQNTVKSVSIINQQDWKDRMTLEQLQMSCEYYNSKIKEVEKSFSDFFQVIKQQ